jgi:predicted nucleic acid-binding protein
MATLRERLTAYTRIGLDSSLFIYHFEAHPTYAPLTEVIFQGIEAGNWEAVTSTITLMELTVRPWQLEREDVAREYEALLVNFPHLMIADINRDVARRAAQLRATHRLRPADALQVATTLVHQGDAFITNDRRLARLESVLDILILDDYLSETE